MGRARQELGGALETTLSHWADAAHAQDGTVVIPHMPLPNGETAALIATGRADTVEMLLHAPYFRREYYRYLNGGYRVPLVGGTDKMTSQVPVGLYRTYVYIPPEEAFSYENWCKYLRQGRTFLSSGPIVRFTVNGTQGGHTVATGQRRHAGGPRRSAQHAADPHAANRPERPERRADRGASWRASSEPAHPAGDHAP